MESTGQTTDMPQSKLPDKEDPATFLKIEAMLKERGVDYFLMTVTISSIDQL